MQFLFIQSEAIDVKKIVGKMAVVDQRNASVEIVLNNAKRVARRGTLKAKFDH